MLDLDLLRRDPETVLRSLLARGVAAEEIEALLALDTNWRSKTAEVERLRHDLRNASEDFAKSLHGLPKGKAALAPPQIQHLAQQKDATEATLRDLARRRLDLWRRLPNLPLPDVPEGANASANAVRDKPPALPEYDFPLRDYLDVGTRLGLIDIERATTASGTRFGALVGDGVLLAFALVRHALDVLLPEGFTPILPPVLLAESGMRAMGYLEHGADEVYRTQDDLFLVGTSEQSIGAMHTGHTFAEEELPARFVAFSSCFRREAGSHGREVHGILRVHQFEKVEMFSFCHPAHSKAEHTAFLEFQKRLMDDLELPYRVVELCTGEMGFSAAQQFDLETWFPSRGSFIETHSTSNTTDFQTRRLPVKFRPRSGGAPHLVHAVNGTAYAIQRTLAALLEVHQQADGSVRIPEVLRPLLGGRDALQSVGASASARPPVSARPSLDGSRDRRPRRDRA